MLLLMDDILQKLRLLNYENRFLKEKYIVFDCLFIDKAV